MQIQQFRKFWKTRVENELGVGTWGKIDSNQKTKSDPSQYTKLLVELKKIKMI